jgi:hypothetical protein
VSSIEADSVLKFAAAYETLDMADTLKVNNAAAVDGTDFGVIKSHQIVNGIMKFDDIDSYSYAVSLSASNLNNVIEYVSLNVTDGSTVAFQAGSDTWVFQDNATGDSLIKLVGVVNIAALSSTAWASTTLHIE